jgi:hypothetical protein
VAADNPRFDDDPSVIGTAVRILAADVHRVITQAATGEPDGHDEALAEVQQRAVALLDRVGQEQWFRLRRWLVSLQQRVFTMQWLHDSLEDQVGIRRKSRLDSPHHDGRMAEGPFRIPETRSIPCSGIRNPECAFCTAGLRRGDLREAVA